ncbi:hypothetical protein JAAARDRAFT_502062 [Jaapia argillacea MUCL 33604]|uniref:Uncharacterized protein n=1 Tax=Jaapia argillacea MUCL 33604 TaxID=933084 RepID=A0A067PMY1_9AGAM|nr:hypothetical protein JAAARDRAFT_502062 [Jaapia argillacea MUCL 33604]
MYSSALAPLFLLLVTILAQDSAVFDTQSQISFDSSEFGITQDWDLQRSPNASSTSALIFGTASSLLQGWSNSRWPRGHSIVPGVVPTGTLLYHGRQVPAIPNSSEWVSMDPEHAYLFCDPTCWFLTLVAVRPLKIVYFDGSSAADYITGAVDAQDVLLWGEVREDRQRGEMDRMEALCEWGGETGVDGFVRFEIAFEIMLCSFTAGVEVVSFLDLVPGHWNTSTLTMPSPQPTTSLPSSALPPSPTAKPPLPEPYRILFSFFSASSWHYHKPGDTRIQLDYSSLFIFYDPSLTSLVRYRQGRTRGEHRLDGINKEDGLAAKRRVKDLVRRSVQGDLGSGVDWKVLMEVIIDRYASRLELLAQILDPDDPTFGNSTSRMSLAQTQVQVMLTPYLVVDAFPHEYPANSSMGERRIWAVPIFKHCFNTHLSMPRSMMTREELVLFTAIRETNQEICRVLVNMWADITEGDLFEQLYGDTKDKHVLFKWNLEIGALIRWLDWSIWVKCKPVCNPDEGCYLERRLVPNKAPKPFCIRRS